MRRCQILGANLQGFGAGNQIGLVCLQEGERRGKHRGVIGTRAQVRRRQAGHVEQARRAVWLAQRPYQRTERKLCWIVVCQRGAHYVVVCP